MESIKTKTCKLLKLDTKKDYCLFEVDGVVKGQAFSYVESVLGYTPKEGDEIKLQPYFIDEADSREYAEDYINN